ncbi:MAG: MauE/DoxX family redox-associated membrane protein [Pseudomonadota bacterium]
MASSATLPSQTTAAARRAVLYRMVTPEHVCPAGLKARHLLRQQGFELDDRPILSRAEQDAFKAEHGVATTPQVFIDGERIGGYDDLQAFLGIAQADTNQTTYRPVIAIFSMTALMAAALVWGNPGVLGVVAWAEYFLALSMCALAIQKLQNVETFATGFLGYDLLAQRYVPYARMYPYAEGSAGVGMLAAIGGGASWLMVPAALTGLVIGSIGAVSVFKAVYVDRRELKCACVGGDSRVPLGFVSFTENVMMIAMGVWMLS